MKEDLELREIIVLLPKLMIAKIEKRISNPATAYRILKVIGLNPVDGNNYKMVDKWSLPKYLFLKRVSEKPIRYEILSKNFWDYVSKKERGCEPIRIFITYLKNEIAIVGSIQD